MSLRHLPLLLSFALAPAVCAVEAEGVTEDKTTRALKPYDRKADTTPADSPAAGQKGFRRAKIPAGFKASLWATEPLLANPVAFSFDGKGRMFIAETHRYRTSVLDIRHYMFMLEDDLANRNQTDWERSIKKNFPNDWQELGKESEVVRLVEDTDGDGKADKSGVYADGFNSILDGIASGVLARPDGVWLTNIPGLYKLTGQGADGKAEKKEEVFRGFGVRFNYTGHDLHGLIKGPDGRLYFSIGDRGASVKTKEGTTIEVPDEGAIFRCEEDGSHLELVMRGLRNPQELAFDDYGNLFTCDNDSDQGDRERLVYVVEGGDAGWRVGYQHCPQPAERNPWLAEHMWEPRNPAKNQPASILCPVANLPDGPGGLVHYPGTGLPEKYNGCFFLACYKGSSLTSQVAVFKPVPDGAGFKLEMLETFIPGCQATDVDFGPDSRMYVSFWDEGWERTAQGRIMKVEHEEARKAQAAQIAEVQKLLGEGMKDRSAEELVKLLGYKDQRVRLEAQWELAGRSLDGDTKEVNSAMAEVIQDRGNKLQRLHAVWALGQILRAWAYIELNKDPRFVAPFLPYPQEFHGLQNDADADVRAAWLKVWGDQPAMLGEKMTWPIIGKLDEESPRVRLVAAQTLGKHGHALAVYPLLAVARREQDKSQEMRHVISHALAQLSQRSEEAWKAVIAAADDKDPAVRMVVLQAVAHVARTPEKWYAGAADLMTGFTRYEELVPEVARLVNDRGLRPSKPLPLSGSDALTVLRGYNDAFRRGGVPNADHLMMALCNPETRPAPELIAEALHMLDHWTEPPARDLVNGLFRPARDRLQGAPDLGVLDSDLLESHPLVTSRILDLIARQKRVNWSQWVSSVALNQKFPAVLRAKALRTLGAVSAPELAGTVAKAITDPNSTVRIAAAGLLGKTDPIAAANALESALAQGSPEDARAAFTELASLQIAEADRILAEQLILLTAGKVPAIARLELLEAAAKREAPVVKEALAKYEASLPKDDVVAKFAACLEGGDAVNGKRLFNEHPVAACKRCHMVQKSGGEAGPALDGIASRKDRRHLLESILLPNAQIAESFRMIICNMKDGTIKTGVLRAESADSVTIQNPGEEPETVKKADIASRDAVPSAMLPGMDVLLSKRELRDLVEYVASLKE
jgi:quinoprotein glucose dehydrogenase